MSHQMVEVEALCLLHKQLQPLCHQAASSRARAEEQQHHTNTLEALQQQHTHRGASHTMTLVQPAHSGARAAAAAAEGSAEDVGDDKAHLFVFTNDKAGMSGVDKHHVNKVVYEMSAGSRFYKHAEKQDQKVDKRLEEMKRKMRTFDAAAQRRLERRIEAAAADLERSRRMDRVCVVCDMDQFYAAVEMRDDPSLATRPMAVGGLGMICTANYEARKFGVRSAMPGFIGRELCPQLVFVRPNFDKYRATATQIQAVFAQYDPHYRAFSLDEAYLDLTQHVKERIRRRRRGLPPSPPPTEAGEGGEPASAAGEEVVGGGGGGGGSASGTPVPARARTAGGSSGKGGGGGSGGGAAASPRESFDPSELFEEAAAAVAEMRTRIAAATRLTASAGVAPNFMLAKVCADKRKPDGQFALGPRAADAADFLRDLPVRKIGGIGKVMEKSLAQLGIHTCGQLHDSMAVVWHVFTPRSSEWLLRVALGVGSPDSDAAAADALLPEGAVTRKGISCERTFAELSRPEDLDAKLREICGRLASDMAERSLQGRTVTLKIKTVEFDVLTRARTSDAWVATAAQLYEAAAPLLRAQLPLRLRLMGVRVSHFRGQVDAPPDPRQRSLADFFGRAKGGGTGGGGGGGGGDAQAAAAAAARACADDIAGAGGGGGEKGEGRAAAAAAASVAAAEDEGWVFDVDDDDDDEGDGGEGIEEAAPGDAEALVRQYLLSQPGDDDGGGGGSGGGGGGGLAAAAATAPVSSPPPRAAAAAVMDVVDLVDDGTPPPLKGPPPAAAAAAVSATAPGGGGGGAEADEAAQCPICCARVAGTNSDLNRHVDLCLNRAAVREACSAAAAAAVADRRKRRRIEDYF